ncbi:MAG TPA: zinc-ribbon domain-containing protein [Nitrososphaera sp.]|nr:zinc-ribbon domain-containing protein [Nitrososphaera sp.]
MMAEDMAEKKLRGSGGYAIAKVSDDEQKMANLGGPELFLAGIGRLDNDRFVKYFCNKCERDFEGAPTLSYENPNEDVGEGVTLIEKGEYKCRACNSTIAQYRKFNAPAQAPEVSPKAEIAPVQERAITPVPPAVISPTQSEDGFVSISQLVGMSAYDGEAMLVGKIEEVGLRKQGGKATISVRITPVSSSTAGSKKEVQWEGISKIGDIVLLKAAGSPDAAAAGKCPSCGYQNEAGAAFCEECGTKL